MKKILYIENDFEHGGREKVSLDILEMLVDTGEFQVDLCLLFEGGEWDHRIPQGVNRVNIFDIPMDEVRKQIVDSDKRHSLAVNVRAKHFLRAAQIVLARKYRKNRALRYGDLFSHIKQEHYDYVVASSLTVTILPAIAAHVNADRKYVWSHRAFCKYSDRKKFNLNSCAAGNNIVHDMDIYEKFDKIVCVSDLVKNLFDYYFPKLKNKSIVLYNAMNMDKIRELSDCAVNDIPTGKIMIATVGRVEHEKGQHLAVAAAKRLKEKGLDFVWYFIGDGRRLKKLNDSVHKEKLDDVCVFVGAKDNPYPYIKACDIYCQPSLTEAYCTTVNEARILGKPIVATRFTGITEQITHGIDGLICDIDSKALSENIIEMADDAKRAEFAECVHYPNESEMEKMFSVDKLFI